MDKRKENDIVVKIVCVIASFALWLYINGVENPITTGRIKNIPVTVVNVETLTEQGLTLLPNQDFTANLTIKGPSAEVNNLRPDQFKLTADISGYAFKPGEFKVKVQVVGRPAGDYEIIDTDLHINVKFDQYAKKSVSVRTDINVATKAGFTRFDPENKLSNVDVSGPAQYVNSVSYVMAKQSYKDIDKDLSVNLPLQAYDEDNKVIDSEVVKIEPSSIDLVIPVRKTKTVSVNIKTKGTPSSKDIIVRAVELTPDKIDIAGDAELLNTINSIDTEVVDLSTLNGNKTQDVKLIVPDKILLVNSKGFVTLKISTDKIIQKSFTLDINFNNLGADYNVTSDKPKVTVTLQGIENRINALTSGDIKCFVDLANIAEGEYTMPVVVKAPDDVNLLNINPQSIKVNITKKNPSGSTGNNSVPANINN